MIQVTKLPQIQSEIHKIKCGILTFNKRVKVNIGLEDEDKK